MPSKPAFRPCEPSARSASARSPLPPQQIGSAAAPGGGVADQDALVHQVVYVAQRSVGRNLAANGKLISANCAANRGLIAAMRLQSMRTFERMGNCTGLGVRRFGGTARAADCLRLSAPLRWGNGQIRWRWRWACWGMRYTWASLCSRCGKRGWAGASAGMTVRRGAGSPWRRAAAGALTRRRGRSVGSVARRWLEAVARAP